MRLSIIIPAWNEVQRLPTCWHALTAFVAESPQFHQQVELIFVDDGSTDGSLALLKSYQEQAYPLAALVVLAESHRGKGHAVRQGMLQARGDICLFTDVDLSTPLTEFAHLSPYLARADVVIASRAVRGAAVQKRQSLYRTWGGKLINLFVQALAVPGINDTQCGFKLFTQKAAHEVFRRTTLDGFSFDVEALFLARRLGFRIAEVPVLWINSPESKVRPLHDGLQLLRDLLVIRANARAGKYGR